MKGVDRSNGDMSRSHKALKNTKLGKQQSNKITAGDMNVNQTISNHPNRTIGASISPFTKTPGFIKNVLSNKALQSDKMPATPSFSR